PVKSVDAKSKEAVDHIIGTGSTPVVFLRSGKTLEELLAQNDLFELSRQLGARRTILVSPYPGLMLGEHLSSHPTEQDIRKALHEDTPCNVSRRLLELIVAELSEAETEIILLGDAPGDLYQEIFTHRGCGTLFTHSYPNVIRTAKLSDTHQIALLLRPTVQNASVLPVSEDQIAEHISQFSVYTVNSQIVALAKLTPYGSAVELGKFATLPRYQGKGRARELALYLLEKAKRKSFRSVFALSMNPVMWKFFEHLGFSETSRDKLPEEWSKQYDHSRPSKAFWLDFPVRKSRPVQSAQSPSAS
ncbi:MAG: GNAT family N-acetyltransferase, partial [Bdellovibrionales bacterium]|nr:GNAT family N-acetyltransferase [Bdellovibrionales bacterium]